MQTKTKLFIISGLIVLIIGLAAGAYFLLKTPDDVKEWHNAAGQLHRENDQPAMIGYYEDGEIWHENWYLNGQRHRENDQPAMIAYDENGEIGIEVWYLNDQIHRDKRYRNGELWSEIWSDIDGQKHRENDQPAEIWYDRADGEIEYEAWFLNGQRHRENDQPALIRYGADGIIFIEAWYLNGQKHRENDQPAEIQYYKNGEIEYEAWFLNGQLIKEQPPKPGRP